MKKVYALLVFAIAGLLLSAAGLVFLIARARTDAAPPSAALAQLRVLDFDLIDARGEPVDETIFDGRVTVLSFIFTRCPLACPGMTTAGVEAQRRLEGSGVRFVSISVDPEHDTPGVLADYAASRGIDPANWTLATGDKEQIYRLVREGMMFFVEEQPENVLELPDGSTMPNIAHPSKLILVGPDRRVLGLYDYAFPEEIDRLVAEARGAVERLGG